MSTTIMLLWFVFLSGNAGYIEPLNITPAACGRASSAPAGLHFDREVNPTIARWADCQVDIVSKVRSLPEGTYELAATGLGPYNAPDPHTSSTFVISPNFEPPAEQTPVTSSAKFSWTQEAPLAVASTYRYELELDGAWQTAPLVHTCVASPANALFSQCSAPVPAIVPGNHKARVRAVDTATSEVGDPSVETTFDMRVRPGQPKGVTVIQVKPGS